MSYSAQSIRNICLLGHSGSGKTTLAESLLFVTGAIDRMGKTPDGNTVCDYDPEEVKRQISVSMAVAPVEYKGCKINVLDAPGNFDFAGEVVQALCAAALEGREVPPLPPLDRRMDTAARQFALALAHKGEKIACLEMRKHLAWYLKGVSYASDWKEQACRISTAGEFDRVVAGIKRDLR